MACYLRDDNLHFHVRLSGKHGEMSRSVVTRSSIDNHIMRFLALRIGAASNRLQISGFLAGDSAEASSKPS